MSEFTLQFMLIGEASVAFHRKNPSPIGSWKSFKLQAPAQHGLSWNSSKSVVHLTGWEEEDNSTSTAILTGVASAYPIVFTLGVHTSKRSKAVTAVTVNAGGTVFNPGEALFVEPGQVLQVTINGPSDIRHTKYGVA